MELPACLSAAAFVPPDRKVVATSPLSAEIPTTAFAEGDGNLVATPATGGAFAPAPHIAFAKAPASAQSPCSRIAAGAVAEAHCELVSRAPTPTKDSSTLDDCRYCRRAALHRGAASFKSNQGMAEQAIGRSSIGVDRTGKLGRSR